MSESNRRTTNTTPPAIFARLGAQLKQREAELLALLDADQAHALQSATGDAEVNDTKDAAAHESNASMENTQVAHAHAELSRVLAAQRRLQHGTYGFCEDCGESIDERRLLVLPSTSRCKACQTAHERS